RSEQNTFQIQPLRLQTVFRARPSRRRAPPAFSSSQVLLSGVTVRFVLTFLLPALSDAFIAVEESLPQLSGSEICDHSRSFHKRRAEISLLNSLGCDWKGRQRKINNRAYQPSSDQPQCASKGMIHPAHSRALHRAAQPPRQ